MIRYLKLVSKCFDYVIFTYVGTCDSLASDTVPLKVFLGFRCVVSLNQKNITVKRASSGKYVQALGRRAPHVGPHASPRKEVLAHAEDWEQAAAPPVS